MEGNGEVASASETRRRNVVRQPTTQSEPEESKPKPKRTKKKKHVTKEEEESDRVEESTTTPRSSSGGTITLSLFRIGIVGVLLLALYIGLLSYCMHLSRVAQEQMVKVKDLETQTSALRGEVEQVKDVAKKQQEALKAECNMKYANAIEKKEKEFREKERQLQQQLAMEKEIDNERERLRKEDREKERIEREGLKKENEHLQQTLKETKETFESEKAEHIKSFTTLVQSHKSLRVQVQQLNNSLLDCQQQSQQQQPQQQQNLVRQEGEKKVWEGPISLAFFPDYRAPGGNPYQEMLYAQLMKENRTTFIVQDGIFPSAEKPTDPNTKYILHIHWLSQFVCHDNISLAEGTIEGGLNFIDTVKEKGWKIIWTLHNIFSHSCPYRELEATLRHRLGEKVDVIHVMCEDTVTLAKPHYTLPPEKIQVIPHSSYVGLYQDSLTQQMARRSLGLEVQPDTVVLLFFGLMRHYKGITDLLDAFIKVVPQAANQDVPGEQPSLDYMLIVAGEPFMKEWTEEEFTTQIIERVKNRSNIKYRFGVIPDKEVQYFYKAADVAVLPYRTILNSGSLFTAFTFGRPVIAPRLGCMSKYLTEDISISYEPNNVDSLAKAIAESRKLKSLDSRTAAYQKALAYTPEHMASDFAKLVKTI